MEKEQTNLRIRTDIKDRGVKAISKGLFVGINDLSGLVEFAVDEILKTKGA